jgi:hypothetical protein
MSTFHQYLDSIDNLLSSLFVMVILFLHQLGLKLGLGLPLRRDRLALID